MSYVTDILKEKRVFAVVGCSVCKNLCNQEAISFPAMQEIREIIKKYHEEHPEN